MNNKHKRPYAARLRVFRIAGIFGLIAAINLVALSWGELVSSPKYVVIHSDDAGMCHTVNEATIDAMERGVVSSASILVACPGFDEIAEYARNHPERDFGVHLNLTCEVPWLRWGPILPVKDVPSLVRPDGSFWDTSEEVALHAKADEAERELRAQIEKAKKAQLPMTHLDHHMFVLLQRPDLLEIYAKLGKEYGLPLRLHRQFPTRDAGEALKSAKPVYEKLIQEQVAKKLPVFDFIEADNYDQRQENKLAYHLKTISEIQPGFSEILIHCAYVRKGEKMAPHARNREGDTKAFMSQDIRKAIQEHKIQVINWMELKKLAKR